MHPTLGRPLTNSEAANPELNPLNPEGHKPCVQSSPSHSPA